MAEPRRQYEPEEEPEEEEGREPEAQPQATVQPPQAEAPKHKKGIGTLVAMALVGVALCFDGIQFLANFLHAFGPPLGVLSAGVAGTVVGFIVGSIAFLLTTALTWNPAAGIIAGTSAGGTAGTAAGIAAGTAAFALSSGLAMFIPFWIGILAQMVFGVWFMLLGRSYNRNFATRLLIHMSMFVSELTPFINALPGITLGVVALILLSRAEAMFGPEVKGIPLSKLAPLFRNQMPLVKGATKASNPLRGEPKEGEGQRQRGLQGTYKEAVLEEAWQGDPESRKYFDVERRYIRRAKRKAAFDQEEARGW